MNDRPDDDHSRQIFEGPDGYYAEAEPGAGPHAHDDTAVTPDGIDAKHDAAARGLAVPDDLSGLTESVPPERETGPHATIAADGMLCCVHSVPAGVGTTMRCPWVRPMPPGGDPVEMWAGHGFAAHIVRGPLRWDVDERAIMHADQAAEPGDPRALSPMARSRLQSAVALLQRVEFDAVEVVDHGGGQVVVTVEGVPDTAWTTLTVVQAPMPDAAGGIGG